VILVVSFQRALLSIGLLGAVSLVHVSDAAAQLDPGFFDIHIVDGPDDDPLDKYNISGFADLTSTSAHSAGVIYVPPRAEGQPVYEEEWVFWDGEPLSTLPRSTSIEIVPRESSRPPPLQMQRASRAEPRRVRARAMERDPGSRGDSCPRAEAAEPERAGAACYVTEIWQRRGRGEGASEGLMTRVGSIESTRTEDGEGDRQEWLLSPEYVYPSAANGVVTQLRPTSTPCGSVAPSPERPIARSICVDLSPETESLEVEAAEEDNSKTPPAAPELTCQIAAAPWALAPGRRSSLCLSLLGAALAVWYRRRDRRS
jgi:hypothetical protein